VITLITGVPGAGKTLNTIKRVVQESGDRAVYYRGIRGLTLPWIELSDSEAADWEALPDGSVVVIDEVQDIFPPRSPNKSEPQGVKALDKHRHRGFDFYFITQKPKGFDHSVRGYCGRHFHYERAFNRNATRQLEWQKAVDDPSDYHTRKEAQTTRVKFDKKYFDVYKSSEIHTHKPRTPKAVYLAAVALLATIGLGAFAYNNISDRIEGARSDTEVAASPFNSDQFAPIGISSVMSGGRSDQPLTDEQYFQQWEPRIPNLPHTAPVYDHLTEVKTYPRPQCISSVSKSRCSCYSQQGTPMDIDYPTCQRLVRDGWFNPFIDESQHQAQRHSGIEGKRDAPQPGGRETPEYVYDTTPIQLPQPEQPDRRPIRALSG
jgi:zona occludens toxin